MFLSMVSISISKVSESAKISESSTSVGFGESALARLFERESASSSASDLSLLKLSIDGISGDFFMLFKRAVL